MEISLRYRLKIGREDKHCGHGQNTRYSTLGSEVHLQVAHNKYWNDSDSEIRSHANDTIGSCSSDHHTRIAVSRLIFVPVIGSRMALKYHYKEEAEAVCCDDSDGDIDDPFVQPLDNDS